MKFNFVCSPAWLMRAGALVLLTASLVFLGSCSDDDDGGDPITTLAGKYQFDEVTLASEVQFGDFTFPVGWDVTDELVEALFAISPCNDPSELVVDLRTNKELYFGCTASSDALKGGTWDEASDLSTLTLNLVVPNPADPQNPNQINLIVKNLQSSGTNLKGLIENYPLSSYQGIEINPPLLISINVDFRRLP